MSFAKDIGCCKRSCVEPDGKVLYSQIALARDTVDNIFPDVSAADRPVVGLQYAGEACFAG